MSAQAAFAGVQIGAALFGGFQQRGAKRAEARGLEENGRLTLLEGEQQVTNTVHDERQAAGIDLAGLAESGVALGSGTAADLIRQSAIEREIEIGNIRAQAQGKAAQYYQAGADARAEGNAALIGGVLQAGAIGLNAAMGSGTQGKLDRQALKVRTAQLAPRSFGGHLTSYGAGGFVPPRLRVLPAPSF
jgi:hypothetical protein